MKFQPGDLVMIDETFYSSWYRDNEKRNYIFKQIYIVLKYDEATDIIHLYSQNEEMETREFFGVVLKKI